MSALKTPFRYDYVGSFLRPAKLKEARKSFEEGQMLLKRLKTSASQSLSRSRRSSAITSLRTENSEEQHGTSTLCGDLTG